MKYSKFEWLVLGIGGTAIVGTVAATYKSRPVPEEIAGQIMLLGVLIGAVHWGRRGGFLTAALATVLYTLLRVPLVVAEHGATSEVVVMVLTRAATFAVVGVLGGELCSRIQYIFARLEDATSIDEWTNVYNQRFITRTLASMLGQHTRYGTPFSVLLLSIADSLVAELRPSRQRKVLRGVASHIRNDVRLVDEVGRLEDGRFLIVLPHTPHEGALVAGDRLRRGVQDLLGAKAESVSVEVMAAPDALLGLQELHSSLDESLEKTGGPGEAADSHAGVQAPASAS